MLLKFPIQVIQTFFNRIKPSVWIISGKELSNQHELSIAYAGTNARYFQIRYKNYITRIVYGDCFSEQYIGRVWIWNIRKMIKKVAPECSLAVIEIKFIESFFKVKNGFKIPRWVETTLDISESIDQIRKRSWGFSDMIRRTKKNNYTYEVTRDKSLIESFYYKMHVPFVRYRHGNTGYIISYERYKKLSRYAELLLIKKQDTFVAGWFLRHSKRDVFTDLSGFKDGDYKYVKEGAMGALIYFSVLWLKEKGYSKVSLGGTNPFLKDGILKYKVQGGAQISDSFSVSDKSVILIEFFKNTQGLRDLLINNPFIFYPEKRNRHAAIFVENHHLSSHDDLKEIMKPYNNYNGIEKFHIYVFGEDKHFMDLKLPTELAKKIEIQSAQCLFNNN